jgi:hypothetical protein
LTERRSRSPLVVESNVESSKLVWAPVASTRSLDTVTVNWALHRRRTHSQTAADPGHATVVRETNESKAPSTATVAKKNKKRARTTGGLRKLVRDNPAQTM